MEIEKGIFNLEIQTCAGPINLAELTEEDWEIIQIFYSHILKQKITDNAAHAYVGAFSLWLREVALSPMRKGERYH